MMNYEIVYEDEYFLVINKFSGLLVHSTNYEKLNNLIEELNRSRKQTFYLVNRIDKDTSGLLIAAKGIDSLKKMRELFTKHTIDKTYLAITGNIVPAKEIKITLSLGASKNKKLFFSNWNSIKNKKTHTQIYKLDKNLVLVKLKTGKTHQIRAHLFSIKCPILNDPIYGKKIPGDLFGQYLHSYKLQFVHPFSGKKITISIPPPEQFHKKLLDLNISYKLDSEKEIKSE